MDRVGQLPDAGRRHDGALADVERRDLVREVDDAGLRARAVDDRVAHAHPRVLETEVGHEPDDRLHVPTSRVCRRSPLWPIIADRKTNRGDAIRKGHIVRRLALTALMSLCPARGERVPSKDRRSASWTTQRVYTLAEVERNAAAIPAGSASAVSVSAARGGAAARPRDAAPGRRRPRARRLTS